MLETALITGAAKGIGYEFTKLCAANKYNLVLVDQDQQQLEAVKKELIKQHEIDVQIIFLDLTEINAADDVYKQLKKHPINILINNAGFGVVGKFTETDWNREHQMIQLHIITLTRLTKLILKDMIENKKGKILNVASLAAFYPGPLMAIYYATKAYILSFSEAIANELKGTGITVTTLCPGFVKTEFQKTSGSKEKIVSKWNLLSSPQKVAQYGYKAMQRGKIRAVPGLLTKLIVSLGRFIPRNTATNILGRLQKINQKSNQ